MRQVILRLTAALIRVVPVRLGIMVAERAVKIMEEMHPLVFFVEAYLVDYFTGIDRIRSSLEGVDRLRRINGGHRIIALAQLDPLHLRAAETVKFLVLEHEIAPNTEQPPHLKDVAILVRPFSAQSVQHDLCRLFTRNGHILE